MRVDQFADGCFQPRLAQRIDDEPALPVAVACKIPMLRLAAPAHAEMRANRGDALRTRGLDTQQMAAIRMAAKRFDFHDLARKRVGHKNRTRVSTANTITPMPKPRDDEPLSQALR